MKEIKTKALYKAAAQAVATTLKAVTTTPQAEAEVLAKAKATKTVATETFTTNGGDS